MVEAYLPYRRGRILYATGFYGDRRCSGVRFEVQFIRSSSLASFPVLPTPAFVSQPWRKKPYFSLFLPQKTEVGRTGYEASQLLSHSRGKKPRFSLFLHGCEIKAGGGKGLGTRLAVLSAIHCQSYSPTSSICQAMTRTFSLPTTSSSVEWILTARIW